MFFDSLSLIALKGARDTMQEPLDITEFYPTRFRALGRSFPTHLCQLEAEQALFSLWYRAEQRKEIWRRVFRLWPVFASLVLAPFAPRVGAFLVHSHPWAMVLVFPFALLARNPGLHVSGNMAPVLPGIVLWAQFPFEGILAWLIVRRRVTVPAVAGQVFYFHYLAALELLMLSGIVRQWLAW